MDRTIKKVDLSHIQHLSQIDFIGNDFAIFDDIRDLPLYDYPTRLNAACFFLCRKGSCKVQVNFHEYGVEEGMLGIVLPDQLVQQGGSSHDFEGIFICISKDFIDGVLPTMQQLFPLLFLVREQPFIHLTDDEQQAFADYHSFLWSRVKLKGNPFRKEISQGLLLSLFYEIYHIYHGHNIQAVPAKSRREELFERFLRLISEYYKENRSVSFYAEKMFLTSKHLSTVVREVSGKTAGEWIDSLVMLEAKALLKSSDLSIQEIADELHFANQSFFGKYFKHHTGVSPKEYRRSN